MAAKRNANPAANNKKRAVGTEPIVFFIYKKFAGHIVMYIVTDVDAAKVCYGVGIILKIIPYVTKKCER